jgi:hypothetical protein
VDRDRDELGRARNARPRDELGRPLPYGARGIPRGPDGLTRTVDETLDEAQRLFDAGRPFHAHEVFEDAWKAAREAGDAGLWKALAQLAVGCTHRMRGNSIGAEQLLQRAAASLAPYAGAAPHDINIAELLAWAQRPDELPMPALRRSRRANDPSPRRRT